MPYALCLGHGAKAAELLKERAERGNVNAQFAYAVLLLQGHDVPMDREKALELFRSAAEGGPVPAQMQTWLLS
jgi:TPR repeat protein